ncbi:DNA circularization protein [Pseudomonas sp. NY11226]|uniref:DNA circularization protein n=1 Tax=Pseudomonas sp. NY11226 TaxID=3400362 RepID=UPI003A83FD91
MSKSAWVKSLNPATYRGVRFGVLGSEARFGRRLAMHEYPNRDTAVAEDMGRSTRRFSLVGFLVTDSAVYGGGDVIEQREKLIAAVEKAGPGLLIHPTYGLLNVSVPDGGLAIVEKWDEGRYFEFHLTFVETGLRVFSSVSASKKNLLETLVDKLGIAALSDFVRSAEAAVSTVFAAIKMVEGVISEALETVESIIDFGSSIVSSIINTVADFAALAGEIIHDASRISGLGSRLTGGVSGLFGRYSGGSSGRSYTASRNTPATLSTSVSPATTAAELAAALAENVTLREAATAAGETLAAAAESFASAVAATTSSGGSSSSGSGSSTGSGSGSSTASSTAAKVASVTALAEAAQAYVAAVAASIADPADAVRLLSKLAAFQVADYSSTSHIGQARTVAQYVTATVLRRAVLAELATVASNYQPSSYDDAISVRDAVVKQLDAEILIAGDLGDDASYAAMREVRRVVIEDLNERGADLAALQTYSFNAALPSLVLANRLYQDANRSAELVSQANPIHPAFMPTSFRALTS